MENKTWFICIAMICFTVRVEAQIPANRDDINFPYKNMPAVLPGTTPLTGDGDLSVKMLDGAHQFIEAEIERSVSSRLKLWNRDLSSPAAYERSVEPNRKRFMQCIGVEDKSNPPRNYYVGLEDKHPALFMAKISVIYAPALLARPHRARLCQ